MIPTRFVAVLGYGLLLSAIVSSRPVESRALQPSAPARTVVPADHSRADPSLAEMRQELLQVIRQRDTTKLAAWLAPDIREGFESPISRAEFLRNLTRATEAGDTEFWCSLRDALEGGLYKDGDQSAFAPFFHLSHGDFEMVITGRNVKVHATPRLNAPVIDILSYDLVNPTPEDITFTAQSPVPPPPIQIDGCSYIWHEIITPSGKRGWLPGRYVYSRLDTYYSFVKVGNRWLLSLIGGGN